MTNYDKEIMAQLNGETPKEKYNYLMGVLSVIEMIATPVRGSKHEDWTIQDAADYINENKLLPKEPLTTVSPR